VGKDLTKLYTHAEIAAELGCTRQNVEQLEARALLKLKNGLAAKGIHNIWDLLPELKEGLAEIKGTGISDE
jgi:DNA-directed RNA polymerase sigma subunit (sigma70/sigma32)